MDDQEKDRLVIRSYPVVVWLCGAAMMVFGFYAIFTGEKVGGAVTVLLGLAIGFLFGAGSTLVAHRRPPEDDLDHT